jgi:hypothetical protein
MLAGRMDPDGKGQVESACDLATAATMVATLTVALLGLGVSLWWLGSCFH